MSNENELAVFKILNDLQDKYNIDDNNIRYILEKNLDNYTLIKNEPLTAKTDLQEKIQFFLNIKKLEGLSKLSIRRYKEELNFFSRYVDIQTASITINDLRGFLTEIQNEKSYKNTTINGKISILRSFFRTLYEEEVISKNPSTRLKNIKVNNKELRQPLDQESLEKFNNVLATCREKALVTLILSSGIRVSEVVKAETTDINWNDNSLIVNGKGDNDRIVYFSVKCKIYLQEYLKTRQGDSTSIFLAERYPYKPLGKSGIEKIFKKIANRTDITTSVSPHILRHNFCTEATRRTRDITIVQKLMGHSSCRTTEIYNKINQNLVKNTYQQFLS